MRTSMNDPIAMLKQDHREAEQMLRDLANAKPGARRTGNVKKLGQMMQLHMQIEEQLVYPVVAQVVGSEEAEEAEIEHGLTREALRQLEELADQPGFGAAVEMLRAGFKHHAREEEREIFPKLKKELDRDTLAKMGDDAMALRASLGGGRRPARRATKARKSRARSGR